MIGTASYATKPGLRNFAMEPTWALLKVSVALAALALPPEEGTLIFDVTPDLGIFVYVLAISLVAGILFGLAPAMESSRCALSSASRGSTSPVRSRRVQDFLIAAQVSLSLVLMISGSMLIRSAINSLKMETGYESKHVVDLDLKFPEGWKYTAARKVTLIHELRTRLAVLPGVAAITSARPPGDNFMFRTAAAPLDGEKSSAQNVQSMLHYTYVQANYFQTLGIPLFLGRSFQPPPGQSEHSVILSESAAKQLWPGQNPIGRSLRLGATDEQFHSRATADDRSELLADGPAYQVVGVDVSQIADEAGANELRLAFQMGQAVRPSVTLINRTCSVIAPFPNHRICPLRIMFIAS